MFISWWSPSSTCRYSPLYLLAIVTLAGSSDLGTLLYLARKVLQLGRVTLFGVAGFLITKLFFLLIFLIKLLHQSTELLLPKVHFLYRLLFVVFLQNKFYFSLYYMVTFHALFFSYTFFGTFFFSCLLCCDFIIFGYAIVFVCHYITLICVIISIFRLRIGSCS